MKKLIIILSLMPFWANAQCNESYSFKRDKQYHALSGVVISIPSYYLILKHTNDLQASRNAAWLFPTFAALGKEYMDSMQGKNISLADISYTIGGALITTFIMTRITKRRIKKNKKDLM